MKYCILMLLLFPQVYFAQPLRELYEEALALGDTVLQMKVLDGWEAMRPADPDLCLARARFCFERSIRKRTNPELQPYVTTRATLASGDTSERAKPRFDTLFYEYDDALVIKAAGYLARGIDSNPDHIVLRTTRIAYLQEANSPLMATEMIGLLNRAKVNGNRWLMQDSLPWDSYDTLSLFLQKKVRYMFARRCARTEDLRAIAEGILALYPDHHQSIVDIGRSYYLEAAYDNALKYFYRAEKVLPHSLETLGYIALCSYYLGDRENAIRYFDKLKEFGDEADRKFADDRIEEMKK